MAEAYILASKGKSLPSKIIRWWQFGYPYTHIAYVLELMEDPYVIEAWKGEVRKGFFSAHHTKGTEFAIFSVEVLPSQKEAIEGFLLEQIGKKYDWLGILGFPFRSKNLQDPDRWFCSELVFYAFKQAGVGLLRDTHPSEVSPRLFLKSPFLRFEISSISR